MSWGTEQCKQILLYGIEFIVLKAKEQVVCTSNHRLDSFRVRDGHNDGLCAPKDLPILLEKSWLNAPQSLLNLLLLLSFRGHD